MGMKLTIDRKTWFRGQGALNSRLLRADGTRCCVGFYLHELGVPDEALLGVAAAHSRRKGANDDGNLVSFILPPSAEWLVEDRRASEDGSGLYDANDDRMRQHSTIEEMVAAVFAKHDVQVEFID